MRHIGRAKTGSETDVWYCPVCGYVDPRTTDTRCPKHRDERPPFREINYGYYVRVGPEEREAS